MSLIKRGGMWYLRKKIRGQRFRVSTGIPVGTKAMREAAVRRAAELELEIHSGKLGWTKDVPSLADWWKTYDETYTIKKRAPHRDRQMIKHALAFFGGETLLDAVRKSECLRYMNHRRLSYGQGKGHKVPKKIAEGTVQRERSFLQAVWEQAIADGVLDVNPWKGIERVPYDVRDRLLTDAEQAVLMERLTPRYQRWLIFMLGTGVRLDECRKIDATKDINWGQRLLRVTGKFGKSREVPFSDGVARILREQLENEGRLWCQDPSRLREVLREACARTSASSQISASGSESTAVRGSTSTDVIPHLSPHTLRHTFAWLGAAALVVLGGIGRV